MCEREVIRLPAGCKGGDGRGRVQACRRRARARARAGVDVRFAEPSALEGSRLRLAVSIWIRDRPIGKIHHEPFPGAACCQLIDLLSDRPAPLQRGSN